MPHKQTKRGSPTPQRGGHQRPSQRVATAAADGVRSRPTATQGQRRQSVSNTPRRAPRTAVYPVPVGCNTPQPLPLMDEALGRWLEEEVGALQRLAHTQRLKGDYVAAQVMEREIRWLRRQTLTMLHRAPSQGGPVEQPRSEP